ncbi:hypothetical protein [Nocardioides sp.]|uniref:hypothetical protein n=1 Tax=Nocardioides sp. TaxID=35761 RepID=UPI0035B3BC8A
MSVEAALPVADLEPGELWEVLWRPTLTSRWLGKVSLVPAEAGRRVLIGDEAGPWRRGVLIERRWGKYVEFNLGPDVAWHGVGGVDVVRIEVAKGLPKGSVLRIVESGPHADSHVSEIEGYWAAALGRLRRVLRRVADRRDSPRQAVVVIHGIGGQEPGQTLRALVASGVIAEADAESWVMPDTLSGSFELRRATFKATQGRVRPTTDVYELYWAHLISDTTLAQVSDWVRRLLLPNRLVPARLRPAWITVYVVVVVVVATILGHVSGVWQLPGWLAAGGVAVAVTAVLWKAMGRGLVIDVLGDAARYLSPRPDNVARRQAIREAGVELLERMHEQGRYDRIVVLGHSLGSVIAYDVLTYLWIRRYADHLRPLRSDFKPLAAVEVGIGKALDAEQAQELQHTAWKQIRRNTQSWLVTDLVTVGSPLTYASFLMGNSEQEFTSAQVDRVLPTCPPRTSDVGGKQRCTFSRPYETGDPTKDPRTFVVFDHGAPFSVTRWTNLYFETRWGGLTGDIVGGPVAPQFGPWVRDVAMPSPVRTFAHTHYWRPGRSSAHLEDLASALDMNSGQGLLGLANGIPAFVIAEQGDS